MTEQKLALPLLLVSELKMAQNGTPKKISRQEKIDALVTIIFKGETNFTKACQKAGLPRRTGYRYWNKWKQSEEVQQVDLEWWALANKLKDEYPEKAFEGLTRLKTKMIPTQLNIEETQKLTVNVRVRKSLEQYAVLFRRREQTAPDSPTGNSSEQQVHTTPTNT